ncbi:N-acetylmuramoyl-L-alanine amidase [Clostridium sp. MB40-C1]|uniref:N-acetylmuramoyl-L-alanine amidase n=1 Tax=Clostridium sp. MB40-C1 TaxID=3070996 RepID=UPI0027DF980B|nr:N-acetylmuramoyl-L-alanine amidase [Clostridium sp. MB40-C1]WMJ81416.1 N-acetylmuramoyl-L-alanine amidase [Clostridium sp. MB40-C1]
MNIIESNLSFRSLSQRKSTRGIILHYIQHKTWNVFDVHNFHKNERGWSGIGYHFLVDKRGKTFRGRPENTVGAHCLHHNHFMEFYLVLLG